MIYFEAILLFSSMLCCNHPLTSFTTIFARFLCAWENEFVWSAHLPLEIDLNLGKRCSCPLSREATSTSAYDIDLIWDHMLFL